MFTWLSSRVVFGAVSSFVFPIGCPGMDIEFPDHSHFTFAVLCFNPIVTHAIFRSFLSFFFQYEHSVYRIQDIVR